MTRSGLDTHIVIRYLTLDDAKQSSIATRLMEKNLSTDNPGFIPLVVLAETRCKVECRCRAPGAVSSLPRSGRSPLSGPSGCLWPQMDGH